MISFEKVLDLINDGKYVEIKEDEFGNSSWFDIILKEGGEIRLSQSKSRLFNKSYIYDIQLFVPIKQTAIQSWRINYKSCYYYQIHDIYYKLYNTKREKEYNDYSKYFPE